MVDITRMHTQIAQYSLADQAGIHATMCAIVRANPTDPQAWLCLSACVSSLSQSRDCLEQAQRLDPRNPAIHAGLQVVRELELCAMQRLLSGCRSIVPAPTGAPIQRLGEYFQAQGMSADHIQRAIAIQRTAPLTSRRPLLGEILVAQGWSTPEQVADLLMRQTRARVIYQGSSRKDTLGEYLLQQGHISLNQLQSAVTTQLRTIQTGKHIRLGEVLIRANAISAEQLAQALRQQEVMYGQLYY
jgi:hypothetical protein